MLLSKWSIDVVTMHKLRVKPMCSRCYNPQQEFLAHLDQIAQKCGDNTK